MSRKSLFTREEKIAAVSLVIDKGRSTLSVSERHVAAVKKTYKERGLEGIKPG